MYRFSILVLLGFIFPPAGIPLSAQSLLLQVNEAETGHPLFGSFVTLLDDDGAELASALTNEQGRYLFQLPKAGAYSVRAQMIGRETRMSPVAVVRADQRMTHTISLPVRAIELRGITAEGSARCTVRPEEGAQTAVVWEEARKALEVNAWALDQELFRYRMDRRSREYDPNGRRVLAENREVLSGFFREPFQSRPAEDLAADGFVQSGEDGFLAFAPDAAVLLSDAFLNTHCFHIERDDEEDLIGLAFEPVARRRTPDIEGTLWVDASSGELESVDYEYTGYLAEGRDEEPGGLVAFERLPSGAWIVRRWHITMPIMAEVDTRAGAFRAMVMRRVGLLEEGGEVLQIRDQRGQIVASANRALLSGAVFDSVRGISLGGARVFLTGTDWEAQTDLEGRFRIPDLPSGSYTVDASHPILDSLGTEILARPVELEIGRMTWANLAVSHYSTSEYPDEQGARGWVQEADGTPRAGSFLAMLDSSGSQVAATLTDEVGEFFLLADEPGRYRLRIEEVGRETFESDWFEVATGRMWRPRVREVGAEVDLSSVPEGESRLCTVDPGPSSLAGRVLAEVQKVLRVEVWGRKEDRLEHELLLFDRERSPQDLEVWEDTLRAVEGFVEPTFPTRDPRELSNGGFAPTLGDSAYVFAPIPEVVLSRPFLATHCFRIEPSGQEDDLVLAFEPIRQRSDTVDVRGAFFLDRATGELGSMAYRYTEFPGPEGVGLPSGETRVLSHENVGFSSPEPPVSAGGWMSFEKLSDGSWMTKDWGSRIPMLISIVDTTRADPSPNLAVFAVSERGGVVLSTRKPEGDTLWIGTPERASALSADSIWAIGARTLFQPPEIVGGEAAREGRVSSSRSSSTTSVVRGQVVDWEGDDPLQGVGVVLEPVIDPGEGPAQPSLTRSTDKDGRFRFSEIRPGSYTLKASALGREVVEDSLDVETGRSLNLEIRLPTDPIPVEGILVEVESRSLGLELAGFFERTETQQGVFFTQ